MSTKIRRTPRTPVAPSATPAATPAATPTPETHATPSRDIYGARHSLAPTLAPPPLRGFSALYTDRLPDTDRKPGARDRFFAVNLPALDVNAAACLLATAATILRGVLGAPGDAAPVNTVDPLVTYYYANRGMHPATQHTSDADRLDFAASLGMLALRAHARATNRAKLPAIGGRYGIRDASAHAAPCVLAVIDSTLNPTP